MEKSIKPTDKELIAFFLGMSSALAALCDDPVISSMMAAQMTDKEADNFVDHYDSLTELGSKVLVGYKKSRELRKKD